MRGLAPFCKFENKSKRKQKVEPPGWSQTFITKYLIFIECLPHGRHYTRHGGTMVNRAISLSPIWELTVLKTSKQAMEILGNEC